VQEVEFMLLQNPPPPTKSDEGNNNNNNAICFLTCLVHIETKFNQQQSALCVNFVLIIVSSSSKFLHRFLT
jgi:hypothetical protein